MLRPVCLLVIWVITGCCVQAQAPSLYFEKLTAQNGLSNNKVNCILQDRQGFIWIGTDDGLNRYDGNNFTIFRHEPGNKTTLSGNIINDIVEDKEGILWIATGDGGLTRYDYRLPPDKKFKQYKHLPADTTSIPVNIINRLLIDQYGYLWLGTSGYTVLRFDAATERFKRPVTRGTRTVLDMCLDKSGIIWVGKQGGGLLKVNPRDLSFQLDDRYNDLYPKQKLPHATVTALHRDRDGDIWFGSWDKVLYRQPAGSDSEEVFQHSDAPFSFANDEIDCFAEDTLGRLWMGGYSEGLHIYDKKSGRFYNYKYDPSREGTIADNRVNCIFKDRNGRMWIGTNKGMSIHNPLQQQFMQTFLPGSDKNSEIRIFDFYQDESYNVWIGTSEGIYIRRFADQSYEYRPVQYKGKKLSVTKFFKDESDGTFYLGTDFSLFIYDIERNKVSLLPNTEKDQVMYNLYESRVVAVVRDTIEGRPVLLVSPYGHFLTYYDLQEKHWVSRTDTVRKILQRFNIRDNLIRNIYKSTNGNIWLATGKMGLGAWTKHSLPRIEHLYNNPAGANTISNNNVYDIAEDGEGNLWISTYGGGLNYFNPVSGQFKHIPVANNLLEGLQVDDRGYVWMVSNGNLHRYHPLRQSHVSFDLPDIDKSGGVKGVIFKCRRGHMFIAGLNYFIEFDPYAIHRVRDRPEVYLTDFKIFNQSYSDLLFKKEIVLPYNKNYLSIEFAAPDFTAGRNIQYSYMLEGRDRDWINIGSRNFEQFSNLEGGEYVFKIRATNNSGVWNSHVTSLKIVIIPPFWKTWWFFTLCVAVIALIIYALYRYRINELLKRQAIRNKIAQDLHDNIGSTLSSISVYSQVAKIYNQQQRSGELQDTLEKIGDTSGEMISEMNDIVWAINPRHDNMDTILQRMESYARPLLTSQNIQFHLTADPEVKQLNLEMTRRKNFYLIFKESVNNALKYSRCKNMWVHIRVHHHQIIMQVKDDGVGFDIEKVQIHASQSLSGNGLRNMEMRAQEMKGRWSITSEPGKGTIVYLQFPIT